jgi:alkanesulfonate monooxygenase SsuD/methylene tetrahydromethanopterin reductase-like flavin-dependent oxidoreductase (luciferase family)/putative sterol carrier protein
LRWTVRRRVVLFDQTGWEDLVRFGLFYEHQLPRPWAPDQEAGLLSDALEQVELADRLGFHSVWEVEHHFLEEYSHSSAPEVFLAAASQRTKRIRLGHGIVQLPPGYNHPVRVAERVATLDLVSGGRVEFGTGESSSQMELGGFGVDRERKHEQWEEMLDAISRMFVEEPFAGHDGPWMRIPPRNVLPKPLQKPHPPLWVACTRRESIVMAARKGLGALSFSFVEPEDAEEWVDAYYAAVESEECVPGGFAVNPNVAVVLPLMCHQDEATAIERGIDGAHFFGYSLAHFYVFGKHRPGRTNLWEEFERNRGDLGFAREIITADQAPLGVSLLQEGLGSLRGAVGTPEQIAGLCERYERVGVDQVIFVSQAGRNVHEHICESLELFARDVLPRFEERADRAENEKAERLADACHRGLARRDPPRHADPAYEVSPQGEPGPAPPSPQQFREEDSAPPGRRPALGQALRRRGEVAFLTILRGRTDGQLERLVGSGPALRAVFRGMERAFRSERAAGFTGEIQYELTGKDGPRLWTIRVKDDRAEAIPGQATSPAVTLRMSVPTFARMLSRELEPGRALLEGELEVTGDLHLASRLGRMFTPPGTEETTR